MCHHRLHRSFDVGLCVAPAQLIGLFQRAASRIPELVRFAQRLHADWEAAENALLFASSQGQTEGQVNRLKVGHRAKAMDAPVLCFYKLAWWEQGTSTSIEQDPQNLSTFHAFYQ
jgi:hypothetical protein